MELFRTFQLYAQSNPVLAGMISMYGLGVITFLCRRVPERIGNLVATHLTTSLYLDSSANGQSELNFISFMQWFTANGYDKWSRTMSMDSADGHTAVQQLLADKPLPSTMHVSIGTGFHFFFRKGRLFWLYRNKIDKPGVPKNLYSVSLHYFGRNKTIMHDLIQEFMYRPEENKTGIYCFDEWQWELNKQIQPRTMNTVIMNKTLKASMLRTIDAFLTSKEWYVARGINYKKVILLTGKPGTGKSSIIKALANHFNKKLCILSLAAMTDKLLERALSDIPENAFVVMEDIDSCFATHSRENKDTAPVSSPLSNSMLLNILDGINGFHGSVLFATTNYPERIDPAILRKGRVDEIFSVPALDTEEINEYITLMFPDEHVPDVDWLPILGADLQSLYIDHAHHYTSFIASIPR